MSAFSLASMSLPSLGSVLPMILSGIGTGMEVEGNNRLAENARLSAQRQAAALQFQKEQATINAGQAAAASQMSAQEQRRQGALINSRAQALAAASGGGAVDPTVVRIMANNAGETALRASIALYQGEEQARQLRMVAAARGYDAQTAIAEGEARAEAYGLAAKTAVVKGAGSMFAKYGFGQPKPAKAGGDTGSGWTSGFDVPSQDSPIYGGDL
jgi:hypothetical protein